MSVIRLFPMSLMGSAIAVLCLFLPACSVTSAALTIPPDPSVMKMSLIDILTSDFPSAGFAMDDLWIVLAIAGTFASIFVRYLGLLVLAASFRLSQILDFWAIDRVHSTPDIAIYLMAASSLIILAGPISSMEVSKRGFKVRTIRSPREYLECLSSVGFRGATPLADPPRSQ